VPKLSPPSAPVLADKDADAYIKIKSGPPCTDGMVIAQDSEVRRLLLPLKVLRVLQVCPGSKPPMIRWYYYCYYLTGLGPRLFERNRAPRAYIIMLWHQRLEACSLSSRPTLHRQRESIIINFRLGCLAWAMPGPQGLKSLHN
jgi:hypothetical protein